MAERYAEEYGLVWKYFLRNGKNTVSSQDQNEIVKYQNWRTA